MLSPAYRGRTLIVWMLWAAAYLIANSLNNLAVLLKTKGDYAGAEPLYRRALAIRERALGPDHPDTAKSLNDVANVLEETGRYGEAESLYRRALAIREQALGPDHLDGA